MLVVARLEPLKRIDLVIRAIAHVSSPVRLVIVGDGSLRMELQRETAALNLGHRVAFAGSLWGDPVADLYAGALGVVYAPFDEDYGYVTLEAFLSSKPVVTCTDSGGTLEFVVDGHNGFVCAPDAPSLGAAISTLAADRTLAARLGANGLARAREITWDGVVERLLG